MNIILNGQKHDTIAASITALVEALGLNVTQVAIEKNRTIIPRARWQEEALAEGDEIEVVRLIGGG